LNSIKLFLMLTLGFSALAEIKDSVYDEFEGLALVDSLIRDGKLNQAEAELRSISERTDAYYHSLGHLEMAKKNWQAARASYQRASPSPQRELWLARSHDRLNDFVSCTRAYENSAKLWLDSDNDAIRKAACEFQTRKLREAWMTLKLAYDRRGSFPVHRERVALALECGLSQAALDLTLQNQNVTSTQLLNIAELFHARKFDREALTLLEWARTRAPFDADVNLSIAQIYFGRGLKRATVEAFERVAITQPRYHYHLAEFHRQAGRRIQAQYHNILTPAKTEKLKTQLAQWIDRRQYPLIAAVEPLILRSDLVSDDEVRYALAYALSRQAESERSLAYLTKIQRPELLEKSLHLKKQILESKLDTSDKRL
jgi:tetratricopeptide (TPR) repeat protein